MVLNVPFMVGNSVVSKIVFSLCEDYLSVRFGESDTERSAMLSEPGVRRNNPGQATAQLTSRAPAPPRGTWEE